MKILYNLKTGAVSSLRSWKGIVLNWLILFILISLVSLPVRSGFKSMLGSSMVTELLQDSINADVITDLLQPFMDMFSALTTGFFLIIILSFFLNAFITGGLFTILRDSVPEKKASVFFSGAAANFWSFLVIIIINIMIFSLVTGIIIAVPFVLLSAGKSESSFMSTGGSFMRIAFIIAALLIPLMLLTTDYARAWKADRPEAGAFSAIGFGFSKTFKSFFTSYPMMLLLVIIQAAFGWLTVSKLLSAKPSAGGALFLYFILAQILFIVRLWFRAWRYGSVAAAMQESETKKLYPEYEPDMTFVNDPGKSVIIQSENNRYD